MKLFLQFALVFALVLTPSPAIADDTVEKTDCKLAIGYGSMDELKADLLLSAKRLAVNELFGELIASATAVEDFVVTSDQIRASSLGLVREDEIRYYNGDNLGEVCITISVYTTDEDRQQFVPIKLNKRNCVSNPDMTNRELRKFAEEEAIVKALVEYNRKLEGQARDMLLSLMQRVTYLENGLLPDTDAYCVRVDGYVTPIEAKSLLEIVSSPQTQAISFADEFETIDDTVWTNDGPPVNIQSGSVQLESSTGTFPYLYIAKNPFPAEDNFAFEAVFRYPEVTAWGDGITLDKNLPTFGSTDATGKDDIVRVWQDNTLTLAIYVMGVKVFSTFKVDTEWHRIEVRYDGQYHVSLDGELVHTSRPTKDRPTSLWFGNPFSTGVNGEWTSLEVDYIHVESVP